VLKKRICLLFCLFSLVLFPACLQKSAPPDESISHSTLLPGAFTLVLEGYENGEARRVFQEAMQKEGLELELLQSGGNRAEYRISQTDQTHPDWLESLKKSFEAQYSLQQEGERLLVIRR